MITVEHENSMQTIWEHEMIRDICSWKELTGEAWAAHEGEHPSQRQSTQKNLKGGKGKRVPQGVGNTDEKDKHELTDRLKRMSSTCDKCAKLCSK